MTEYALSQGDVQNYHRTDANEEQDTGAAQKENEPSFLRVGSRVFVAAHGPGQRHSTSTIAGSSIDYHYPEIEPGEEDRRRHFEHDLQGHFVHLTKNYRQPKYGNSVLSSSRKLSKNNRQREREEE